MPASEVSARSRAVRIAYKAAISALLIWYLVTNVDTAHLAAVLRDTRVGWFAVSLATIAAAELVSAVRLRWLMRATPMTIGLGRLLRINVMTRFYGLFLPAGIGQGVARWYKVTRNREGRVQFAVLTVVEKAMFLLIAATCTAVPLAVASSPAIAELRVAALPVSVAVALVAGAFVVSLVATRPLVPIGRWLDLWVDRSGTERAHKLRAAAREAELFRGRHGVVGAAFAATASLQLVILVRIALLFVAVGLELPWTTVLWLGSLVFVLQTLPISIAGLGVRESSFAYAVGLYGAAPELGVAVGVLFFAQMVAVAALGALLELADRGDGSSGERQAAPHDRAGGVREPQR